MSLWKTRAAFLVLCGMTRFGLLLLLPVLAGAADPYQEKPSASVQDTVKEPLRAEFSLEAAAGYLDNRAHLSENNCYACHSTFTYLPARSLIDPLAPEVMRTRVMLERFLTRLHDPKEAPKVKTNHIPRVRLLAAVELARHDAATTGKLSPITQQAFDFIWTKLQTKDGGIDWLRVREAPQAIDNWWPAAMIALGVEAMPESDAQSELMKNGTEKLRGWFRAQSPQTLHERALTLLAQAALGGILDEKAGAEHVAALLAKQHADGGWSMVDLAPWQRKDKKPLDPQLTDGYATALCAYVLARSSQRNEKAIAWLKSHQRETGGWFTQSPFARDRIASNSGTSFAVQALAASGEITPPKVTAEQFAAAKAKAEAEVPANVFLPEQDHP